MPQMVKSLLDKCLNIRQGKKAGFSQDFRKLSATFWRSDIKTKDLFF